jgi:hypothetical protein
VDDEFPNYNIIKKRFSKFLINKFTSTFAAIRNAATAINCRFFCVTNPLQAVELIHC